MSVRLYVGNLSYRLTANDLSAALSEVARVESIYLPLDRDTGRPRGFGFVEVADEADADRLIDRLHGRPLHGRALVIHPARPRETRPPRPRDGHPAHQRGRHQHRPPERRR